MIDGFIRIAIDGPSGTGKSTAARTIAKEFDFSYLDTGALYRTVALNFDNLGLEPDDEVSYQKVLAEIEIEISLDPDNQWIKLNSDDVTAVIRSEPISKLSSIWSAIPEIRAYLLNMQRELINKASTISSGIVVEGRDICTNVIPDAEFKFFLTADELSRAQRRSTQSKSDFEETKNALLERDMRDQNRPVSPLVIDPDALVIDTSQLGLSQVVELLFEKITEIDDTEIEEESESSQKGRNTFLPVVAVIGRPNVGKSTLVNRLIGQRSAITEDQPGVTRDRVSYETEWNGREFVVVDTGGWDPNAVGIYEQVARQAEFAINEADVCLLVIDAAIGATEDDNLLIKKLRKASVPILLIANKVDSPKEESDAASLWNLGLGEPVNISALHGRGAGDLLDRIVEILPVVSNRYEKYGDARSVAILGRPNVGKSSLLNYLVGSARAVVSEKAGTTVDPIDEFVEIESKKWLFIDTAGIRKKFKQDSGHEYYAVLRTQGTIDRSEVVVVLIDASEELSDQDRRIINMVEESGKAIIICFNKWDLIDEERRIELDREIDKDLQQQRWIPRLNISASSGRGINKLIPMLTKVLSNWERRIPTSELNRHIKDFIMANPHPLRGGRQAKILFATQVGIRPPTFALFATRNLDEGYVRHLERTLRENFDFEGTPLRLKQRIRNSK